MNCCITELRNKEVINAKNGCRMGQVCDVEIDSCNGCIVAIIIWGRPKCMGFFGREEDIRICWNDIEVIGDDTILVCTELPSGKTKKTRKGGAFDGLFRI